MRQLLNYALKSTAKTAFQPAVTHSSVQVLNCGEQWKLSSDIFYLLNTVKAFPLENSARSFHAFSRINAANLGDFMQ